MLTNSFILEGIPAVIVGILIWFYLPDYPETAKFFSQEEKDFCARRMGPFAPKGKCLTTGQDFAMITDADRYRQAL